MSGMFVLERNAGLNQIEEDRSRYWAMRIYTYEGMQGELIISAVKIRRRTRRSGGSFPKTIVKHFALTRHTVILIGNTRVELSCNVTYTTGKPWLSGFRNGMAINRLHQENWRNLHFSESPHDFCLIQALSHAHFCSHSVCYLSVYWPDFYQALRGSHMIMGVLEIVQKILIDI